MASTASFKAASIPTQRVLQLDAQRLDDELESLFLTSARECLRFLPHSTISTHLPELKFSLRLYLYLNSIFRNRPSPGNAIQGLSYTNTTPTLQNTRPNLLSKPQRVAHLLLDILLPYINTHLRQSMRQSSQSTVSRILSLADVGWRVCALSNLILFLRNGQFLTLGHRVSGIQIIASHATPLRRTAFEFMHRQLVWEGVAEFALFLMPVVRGLLRGGMVRAVSVVRRFAGNERGVEGCVGCQAQAVMPHEALPCRCLYCYVCLRRVVEGIGSTCEGCGGRVAEVERVTYE